MKALLNNRIVLSFIFLTILVIVFGVNMVIAPKISYNQLLILRILLVALSAIGVFYAKKKKKENLYAFLFAILSVNIAFTIVMFFTTDLLGLNIQSAKGLALAKLSDSMVISLVVIILFIVAGFKFKDMYISKGRIIIGLTVGLCLFCLMTYLAIFQPGKEISSEFLKANAGWVLVFILSNAFMEELIFRGIFLQQLSKFLKPGLSILITSLVFAFAHYQVLYAPNLLMFLLIVFILGILWALLIHFTKSMIASVLFHAGTDILIIIDIFTNYGANT